MIRPAMGRAVLAASVFVLAGCGQKTATVPSLQRYNELESPLRAITQRTEVLAADLRMLSAAVAGARVVAVKTYAGRLGRECAAQKAATGRTGAAVRVLARHEANATLRHYLAVISAGLSDEWYEAVSLQRLASLVRRDPLLVRGNDARLLRRHDASAQHFARSAVRVSAAAAAWKSHHAALFRYHPVKTSTPGP